MCSQLILAANNVLNMWYHQNELFRLVNLVNLLHPQSIRSVCVEHYYVSACVCVCLCQYMLPGYSRANNRHILGFLGNTVATFCCEWGCYFQENQKGWKTCIQRTVEFTVVLGGFFRHICSGVIITEASVHGGNHHKRRKCRNPIRGE